jgi:hypothetical protein
MRADGRRLGDLDGLLEVEEIAASRTYGASRSSP